MKISRRNFLAAAPAAAGAILTFKGSAIGQKREIASRIRPPFVEGDALSKLSWDSFYQFIHTEFSFGRGHNTVSLKLVDMTDSRPLDSRRKISNHENFVMKFQGPYYNTLKQGTYPVNHFNLGDFDLFITNGGRDEKEQYYVAVINRILE